MRIPDKFYNFLKYCTAVALPAVNTAILALAAIFNWSWGDTVSQVIVVANTLIAALFCISIAGYKASVAKDGDTIVIADAGANDGTDSVNEE